MQARIFFAGATGAIGRRLTPMLRQAGYRVFGMTRSEERAQGLRDAIRGSAMSTRRVDRELRRTLPVQVGVY